MDTNKKGSVKNIELVKRVDSFGPSEVVMKPTEEDEGLSKLNEMEQTVLLLLKMRLSIVGKQLSVVQQQFVEALEELKQKEDELNRLMPGLNARMYQMLKESTSAQLSHLDGADIVKETPIIPNDKFVDKSNIFLAEKNEKSKNQQSNRKKKRKKELDGKTSSKSINNFKMFEKLSEEEDISLSNNDSSYPKNGKCNCYSIDHLERLKQLLEDNGLVWVPNKFDKEIKKDKNVSSGKPPLKKELENSYSSKDPKEDVFQDKLTVQTQTSGFALLKNKRLRSIQPINLDIHVKRTSRCPSSCFPIGRNEMPGAFGANFPLRNCGYQCTRLQSVVVRDHSASAQYSQCCGSYCKCGCNFERCVTKQILGRRSINNHYLDFNSNW